MEDASFSEKVEAYFSELGRWKVWRSIILGQVLSLLLSGKCILTTLLQSATWQFPTTGQLVLPYITLFILFTPTLLCNGFRKITNINLHMKAIVRGHEGLHIPSNTYFLTMVDNPDSMHLGCRSRLVAGDVSEIHIST